MIVKSKRIAVAVLVLLGFIACASSSMASSREIKWYSYEEGTALGKKLGKKIFIDFYADWCGYCRMMDRSTFKDASVIAILNRDFIPVSAKLRAIVSIRPCALLIVLLTAAAVVD